MTIAAARLDGVCEAGESRNDGYEESQKEGAPVDAVPVAIPSAWIVQGRPRCFAS